MLTQESSFSNLADLNDAIVKSNGAIPLAWVSSTRAIPYGNFGDALSPVVLGALTGLPCVKRGFDSPNLRVVGVGTIGHGQRNGTVHVWGSGVDSRRNFVDPSVPRYLRPANTIFNVHAVRGPLSRNAYEQGGVPTPKVFGDPGCFLPYIVKPDVEKKYELGVIVHISELLAPCPEADIAPSITRYRDLDPSTTRLISTYHQPSWQGFLAKLSEILSCKRILSSSFHGVIVPEAYGIPSLHLHGRDSGGFRHINLQNSNYDYIDHRIADFYLGQGTVLLPVYSQLRDDATDWDKVIGDIDTYWEPPDTDLKPLFDSCPVRTVVDYDAHYWGVEHRVIESVIW